jgi:myo-inositol-1(or 4)-monophosphatase
VEGLNSLESKKIQELSKKLVVKAGLYILNNINQINPKNYKINSDGKKEIVTQIDLDIHNNIEAEITKNFPNHNILSEEDIESFNYGFNDSVWIIDPLDGTSNFSNGLNVFGSSIAYIENYKTIFSNIFIPSISSLKGDYIFWSEKTGMLLNNMEYKNSNQSNLSFVPGNLYTDYKESKNYLKSKYISHDFRNYGSMSYEGAMVALGKVRSMLSNNPKIWDVASLIGIFSGQNKSIYLRELGSKKNEWVYMESMEKIYKNIEKKSFRIGFDIIFINE